MSLYTSPERKIAYNTALEEIAKNSGYSSTYTASQKHRNSFFRIFLFSSVQGFIDAKRKYLAIDDSYSHDEKSFITKFFPYLKVWSDLADIFKKAEDIVSPSKEKRIEKELQQIKGKINPEIKTAIDEIAENFRIVIEEKELNYFTRYINEFKEKYPNGMTSSEFYYERKNDFIKTAIFHFVFHEKGITKLKPNYTELAAKEANQVSKETITKWQVKMYDKLGGFLNDLNKKFTTDVIGKKMNENDIFFKFEDGSRFSIRNSIVPKVSNKGTYFYTYPTTFHNAVLANGEKVANPNELTVKQAFSK
jgi:hypothetical protein